SPPLPRKGKRELALMALSIGNDGREGAVAAGLNWLARHQSADGGWSFDHRQAPQCQGACDEPGEVAEARNAATSLALLALLGAGQTPREGAYKEEVRRGVEYLVSRQRQNEGRPACAIHFWS